MSTKKDDDKKPAKKVAAKKADTKAAPKKAEKAAEKPVKAEAKAAPKKEAAKEAPKKAEKSAEKPAKKETKPAKKSSGKLLADVTLYSVIQRPVITEKSTMALEHNKVVFRVSKDASKDRIKKAVEGLFGVTVTSVNTINIKGKSKRFRGHEGKRQDIRKAIVTLKQGDTIDLAAGV